MESSFSIISMGAFFGLSAGITPGPLLTLVISETLKHGRREGIKIAISPLITDLPLILFTYFFFSKLSHSDMVLGIISLSGGIYLTYLGYETIKSEGTDLSPQSAGPGSLRKGITANLLNPNPYIFWFTVGIPVAFEALSRSIMTAVFYFAAFYVMLIGSKAGIAFIVERSRSFLKNKAYRIILLLLAALLFFFAALFFIEGVRSILNNQSSDLLLD